MQIFKTKTFIVGASLALLVALYALLGFVIAPRIVRSTLLEKIPVAIGAMPAVGEIHINPFLFQAEVKDFALATKTGEKLVGFGRLFVDFQLSSIWHRAYTFKAIEIDAPFANAVLAKDGTLNLAQLQPKPTTPEPPQASKEPMPALRIKSFKVSKGAVSFDDRSHPSEFASRLEPIDFELREFSTGVDGGRFTFTGASKLGETLEWHGHLSVQPLESDGEFRIAALQAHTLWDYLEDQLSFVIPSGTIALNGTYKFALMDKPDLHVEVAQVAVRDLKIRPKDSDADWISVPEFDVTGTAVDLASRHAHIDAVRFKGVSVDAWMEADGSLNLMKLAGAAATSGAAPSATSATVAPATVPGTAAAPWTFDMGEFSVDGARLAAEDKTVKPSIQVVLAPFSLKATGLSSDMAKPVELKLDTHINDDASLTLAGKVVPAPLAADVELTVHGINLKPLQPYIAKQTALTLVSGHVDVDGKVHYGVQKKLPSIQFAGNVGVSGVRTIDNDLHEDFVNWDRVDIQGIEYSQNPDRLAIEQIVAHKPYALAIIEKNSSMNVQRVLRIAPKTAASSSTDPTTAGTSSAGISLAGVPLEETSSATLPAPVSTVAVKPKASGTPSMPIDIKKIVIEGGTTNFTDYSVAPTFSIGILTLEGSVSGLSTQPKSRATVDLHGKVDAFAPASITGQVNMLSAVLYTDINLDFRNMDLTTFNPYSGKFAGYNIVKGKLTTQLHYKVDGRKLDATHHIIVDQLEFGEKTDSKDAVSLPLKLAVALLKDRNGVIDLDIPVDGTLDDPQFKVGPIVWKVFVTLITKAVTAPFAMLGRLFGAGPDLQFVDFKPGVAVLDASAEEKTKTVGKALVERPQLKIEIPISVVPEIDAPALADVQYAARLKDVQSAKTNRKKSDPASPPFEQLDIGKQIDVLTEFYSLELGAEPKYPDAIAAIKTKPELNAAKLDFLSKAIHAHIVIGEDDLKALGQQRAAAVQWVLLNESQIAPERVYLVGNGKVSSHEGQVRAELSLQ